MGAETRAAGTLGGLVLFGVPVRFHFTFFLLILFVAVAGVGGARAILLDVLFLIALFASVLLHELGHAMAARGYSIRTVEIVMYPIGGVARLAKQPEPKAELWIALAGPAVNVVTMTSSKLSANASMPPASSAVARFGRST